MLGSDFIMKIPNDKKKIRKLLLSASFMEGLLLIISFNLFMDRSWAAILILEPLLIYLLLKSGKILYSGIKTAKKESLFLYFQKGKIYIYDGEENYQAFILKDIGKAVIDKEQILHIYLQYTMNKEKTGLQKLFESFIPKNPQRYSFPIYCNIQELKAGLTYIGINTEDVLDEQEIDRLSYLFARYIMIFMGILCFFFLWVALELTLAEVMGGLGIVTTLYIMDCFWNPIVINSKNISIPLVIKCMDASILLSMYVIFAFRLEEWIIGSSILGICRYGIVNILVTSYLISWFLYGSGNGVGTRFIKYCLLKNDMK